MKRLLYLLLAVPLSAQWWINPSTTLVESGANEADWLHTDVLGQASGGLTVCNVSPLGVINQAGTVRAFRLYVAGAGNAKGVQFGIRRKNGSNYDWVGNSEYFSVASTGIQQFTLATPITGVQIGDVPCVFYDSDGGSNITTIYQSDLGVTAANSLAYVAGNNTTNTGTYTPSTWNSNKTANVVAMMYPAGVHQLGDSIGEGFQDNSVSPSVSGHHTLLDNLNLPFGETLDVTTQSIYYIQQNTSSSTFKYQNLSKSSQGWLYFLNTSFPLSLARNPVAIVIRGGTNDVCNGVSWGTVSGYMDSVDALLSSWSGHVFLEEIIPRAACNGTTIATFNTNYATWVSTHPKWTLIPLHDVSAQGGSGNTLATLYDSGDGIHPNTLWQTGLAGPADLAAMTAYYQTSSTFSVRDAKTISSGNAVTH